MAESPIVHTGCTKIVNRAGCVVVPALALPDVGMQHSNRMRVALFASESQGQVFSHLSSAKAPAIHRTHDLTMTDDLAPEDSVRRKDHHRVGKLQTRRPAVRRVVVAAHYEGMNACVRQSPHCPLEGEFSAEAVIGAVVKIACDDQKIHLAIDAQRHHSIESLQS